jgi:hypothetical protein
LELLMKSVARSSERTEEIRFVLMRAPFEKRVQLSIELGGGVLTKHAKGPIRLAQRVARVLRRVLHPRDHGPKREHLTAGSGRYNSVEKVDRVTKPVPRLDAKDRPSRHIFAPLL